MEDFCKLCKYNGVWSEGCYWCKDDTEKEKLIRPKHFEPIETVLPLYETCQLVEELKKRDGVITSQIGPESEVTTTTKGPAIVFVVID